MSFDIISRERNKRSTTKMGPLKNKHFVIAADFDSIAMISKIVERIVSCELPSMFAYAKFGTG